MAARIDLTGFCTCFASSQRGARRSDRSFCQFFVWCAVRSTDGTVGTLDHDDDEDRELTPVVFDKIFLDTTAHTDSRE